jgi:hypothetical protein
MSTHEDEELFESQLESELADRLGMDVHEFVEIFGAGWRYPGPAAGGDGRAWSSAMWLPLSADWFVTGGPPQLMLRVRDTAFELAIPEGLWAGGTHGLEYGPSDRRTVWLDEWDRAETSELVDHMLRRRRRRFRYCRYCRALTPPELQTDPDVCMGCAQTWQGVVF